MIDDTNLLETLSRYVNEAIIRVCSGGIQDQKERDQLKDLARSTVSFPNQKLRPTSGGTGTIGGKPHDIEVRIALSLFHLWKRKGGNVEVISDLGIARDVPSPRKLAELLVTEFLEEACRQDSVAHDLRIQPSGVICIITYARSELLRQAGRLPCPHCCQWCKGTKGLWWHQQQKHKIEYSEATTVASSSVNELAIVLYSPTMVLPCISPDSINHNKSPLTQGQEPTPQAIMDDPIEFAKNGDLEGLQRAVLDKGYIPSNDWDRRGANPLHWAAGSGHLQIVRYLVENCRMDPNQGQRGKRAFSGRTALHWAARNGHYETVEYFVNLPFNPIDLEAATIDGTTAFCWAAWQGHLRIMDLLYSKGCNIHTTNSFGCNAVLWCAQGKGEELSTMEWLMQKGSRMDVTNHNGHGVLHKAAQRGWKVGCHWFVNKVLLGNNSTTGSTTGSVTSNEAANVLRLLGPDTEGYCPSDLAGMEGNEELARFLVGVELDMVERIIASNTNNNAGPLPAWLDDNTSGSTTTRVSDNEQFTWEPHGGTRRMRWKLLATATATTTNEQGQHIQYTQTMSNRINKIIHLGPNITPFDL